MSSNSANTRAKRMDLAFAALLSKDDEEALAAITRIGQEGDIHAIRPLLVALTKSGSSVVQQRITALLHEVKARNADEALIAALHDPELSAVRATVISIFWSAGLDAREHLKTFVDIAIDGSATECFECLTVIENQEIWPEKDARTSLKRLDAALPSINDPYKQMILGDLGRALRYRLGVGEPLP